MAESMTDDERHLRFGGFQRCVDVSISDLSEEAQVEMDMLDLTDDHRLVRSRTVIDFVYLASRTCWLSSDHHSTIPCRCYALRHSRDEPRGFTVLGPQIHWWEQM